MDFSKIYTTILNKYPELSLLTKSSQNTSLIYYSEIIFTEPNLMLSLVWIYKYYFELPVTVYLPKLYFDFTIGLIESFNKSNTDNDYYLNTDIFQIGDLESLERTVNGIVIFGYSDILLNDLSKINKRRLNTIIKNKIRSKMILFSSSNLEILDLGILDTFERISLTSLVPVITWKSLLDYVSLIDLIDHDPENYIDNLDNLITLISESVKESKRVYLSLDLNNSKILQIEALIKVAGITISRKDSDKSQVVINSVKNTSTNLIIHTYQVYIFIHHSFEDPLDIIPCFKDVMMSGNTDLEIFIDSTKIKNITSCLKQIDRNKIKKTVIKDSAEFKSYRELIEVAKDGITVTDNYYLFDVPAKLLDLNLSNLSKKDYDLIRNFVKTKLLKDDIPCKTCQLSCPSSPKDRSRKLNSLSNKINCFDYRCDVTCEIFKNYTIGVIIWNETFANRKEINIKELKNQNYIYQTTNGNWKYTNIV